MGRKMGEMGEKLVRLGWPPAEKPAFSCLPQAWLHDRLAASSVFPPRADCVENHSNTAVSCYVVFDLATDAIEGKIVREPTRIRVFISYSRKDTVFVDRLDVSLKARGFYTWVDRRNLEPGEDFQDAIERAIERCQVLLVILSPDAVASRNVKLEYRYALKPLGLVVIPVLYKPVEKVPYDLNDTQWVDFQGSYEDALRNLVNTLARLAPPVTPIVSTSPTHQSTSVATPHPGRSSSVPAPASTEPELVAPQPLPPSPALSLKDLYDLGSAAYARGELEQAAIFFRQIVDENPGYLNGRVARDLKDSQQTLQNMRIADLRADAHRARQEGEWRREITDWQAILVLNPKDSSAKDAHGVAQHNQKYEDMYAIVGDRIKRGELDLARQTLRDLWAEAPYYGDPNNYASKLHLIVPPSYEATVEKQQAQDAARQKQQARVTYSKETFSTRYPVSLLPYILLMLSAIGVLGGLLVASHPVATGTSSGGNLANLTETGVVIIASIVAFSILGYMLGYRRVIEPLWMIVTALCAIVVSAVFTYTITNLLPASPTIRAYQVPYLGTLQLTTNTPWAFGGLFGAAYGLLFIAVGEVIVIISQIVEGRAAKYFFGSLASTLGIGALVGLAGAVIGLTIGFFGWMVSGIICGALLGLIVLAFCIPSILDKEVGIWLSLYTLPGGIVALALVNWLFCWFPFRIDSSGVLVWAIWAIMPLLALLGLAFTIANWIQRPSRSRAP